MTWLNTTRDALTALLVISVHHGLGRGAPLVEA
jgi:hypothetical protein